MPPSNDDSSSGNGDNDNDDGEELWLPNHTPSSPQVATNARAKLEALRTQFRAKQTVIMQLRRQLVVQHRCWQQRRTHKSHLMDGEQRVDECLARVRVRLAQIRSRHQCLSHDDIPLQVAIHVMNDRWQEISLEAEDDVTDDLLDFLDNTAASDISSGTPATPTTCKIPSRYAEVCKKNKIVAHCLLTVDKLAERRRKAVEECAEYNLELRILQATEQRLLSRRFMS